MAEPRGSDSDAAATEVLRRPHAFAAAAAAATRLESTLANQPTETNGPRAAREATGSASPGMPRGAGSTGSSSAIALGTSLSTDSRVASAKDALRQDEIRRSRLLAKFGVLIGAAVAVALLFLPGHPVMTRITWISLTVVTAGNVWLYYLTTHPELYVARNLALVWGSASLAVATGVTYFGVFSAGAIVVSLGVYFLALGQSFALAMMVYAICAGIQGFVAGLIIFRVIPDPGLVRADYQPTEVLLILEGLIQLVLGAIFIMARASREATLTAVTDYERAVRALAHREALLQEARQDLEKALHIGGVGRFTGQTLGSFRLGNVLGRGSMGEVYEAVHMSTGEPAAVKLLQRESMGNPSYVMRFLREVKAAATLDAAHVVRVLEVGDASAPMPYLAMERLRGHDLAHLLRVQRRLSPAKVIELVDQVGKGLTAAAAAGIVHRDIKPQNLFLADQPGGDPVWKILDFGVSKLAGNRGTLTEGNVVGTPIYMAPEQAQGLDVDRSADLYALAAIAYRCITGHLPFRGKDVPTIMYQVVYKMPVKPSVVCETPIDVDAALIVAMAKNPASRFASAEELRTALDDAFAGRLSDEIKARARQLASMHPWRRSP